MNPSEAAANALKFVLGAVPGERLLIICDDEKFEIGEAFAKGALEIGLWTRLLQLKTSPVPRERVSPQVLEILTGQTPDIYINLLRGISDETPFRIRLIHLETRSKRARLGHCPGVTMDMLTEGALALTAEEHTKMQNFARRLIQTLSGAIKVEISTPAGTNLNLNVEGRPFFTDAQLDWKTMKWMNLPTGEVIVAPVENSMRGTLVCDVAIGGIGPISEPVTLDVQNGRVKEVFSENEEIVKKLKRVFMADDWSNVVGEFAFGVNPKARLTKEFLEAEKVFGTVHVAFGNNLDMPQGKNPSKNHVDLLMSHPSVRISKKDGSVKRIMENGSFCF